MSSGEPPVAARSTLPHLPGIDGLRGLAVVGVLLFHDGRLPGGYLGVDLFFVLSGYLITSLLLVEWQTHGRIDLPAFWARRARRLFPALLGIFPFVAWYALECASLGELDRIRHEGWATLAYVANWYAIYVGDAYWDLFEAPSPFEHTWSLAIEEQFYLLWPLAVAWLLGRRSGSRAQLTRMSVLLAAISGAAMVGLADAAPGNDRVYFGTDTRGVAILAGCALAGWSPPRGDESPVRQAGALDALGLLALVGLAWAWWALDGNHPWLYRGGLFACQLAVLVVIVCASRHTRGKVAALLSVAPLRWLGLASYGIYLWHWPLFVWLTPERLERSGLELTVIRFGLTLAVAALSYFALERPIRRRGFPLPHALAWTGASFTAAAALLFGSTLHLPMQRRQLTPLPIVSRFAPGSTSVLVLGDSVAQALGDRMRKLRPGRGATVIERGTPDCSVLDASHATRSLAGRDHTGGDCDARWLADARVVDPDIALILLGGGHFASVEIDGSWQTICEEAVARAYVDELELRIAELQLEAGVVWLARIPHALGSWRSADHDRRVDCFNAAIDRVLQRMPELRALDLAKELCPSGPDSCLRRSRGFKIRPDGLHFAGPGARQTAEWTLDTLLSRRP